jgi:hypothetical protein
MGAAVAAIAFITATNPSLAAKGPPRPGAAACREAVNGLISLLDAKADDTALYRDTYGVVVDTCGPAAPTPQPAQPPGRDACHDLAAALVDLIEDGKMLSSAFVKARGDFAVACRPK